MSDKVHTPELLGLFIGGPCDGEKIRTEGLPVVRMRKRRPPSPIRSSDGVSVADAPEEHLYYREQFQANETRWIFYRHECLTLESMVQKLVDGYKPNT